MLLAFHSETAAQLQSALSEGTKKYLALVRGEWNHTETSITIDTPILVHDVPKEACTKFTLIATRDGTNEQDHLDRCSLVWCQPLVAGRTHQIRRHAAALGHPIVGDTEHGDSRINRWWRTTQGLDRLLLHCWSIDLKTRPSSSLSWETEEADEQLPMPLVAPLPVDLLSVLQRQEELWSQAVLKEPCLQLEWMDETGGTYGRHYRRRMNQNLKGIAGTASHET